MEKPVKKIATLVLAACALAPAWSQTTVGVSIGINQPGVYGRIDIGNQPQPRIVYPQPVIIAPPVQVVQQQPVYLYVPPGHQKNWAKHCKRYNACGQPVYFVKEEWVRERYEEHRRSEGRPEGRREGREDREHGRGDERHGNGRRD